VAGDVVPACTHLLAVEVRAAHVFPDRAAAIAVYCSNRACRNSAVVAAKLARLGSTSVRRYEDGRQDWIDSGLLLEHAAVPTAG
jgi:rhodanese-related sulfurtransferase